MHVVFLTEEYPKSSFSHGGVGTFVQTLARYMVKKGNRISVVGINNTDYYEHDLDMGINVYRLKKQECKGFTWFLHSRAINRKLRELNRVCSIDIIEGSEMSFAFMKKIASVKYVIRLHGGHHFFAASENRSIDIWKAFQEKRSIEKADYVLGVSQYVLNETRRFLSFEGKSQGVILNPGNFERFYAADHKKLIKGRIFFAGTVCEKKGIRQLIQAMPLIKQEIPEAHLVIAGRDWKFPKTGNSYIEYLREFIEPSMRDSIFFLGSLKNEDIPQKIEEAQVCCYPSHMEAMPLAWIEVMAMGKPFIGSILGPGPEVIRQNDNGVMCDPRDPVDIAKHVIKILSNRDQANMMGERARSFALNNFSLDVVGEKNIKFYYSLL